MTRLLLGIAALGLARAALAWLQRSHLTPDEQAMLAEPPNEVEEEIVGMPTTIRQALGWNESPYVNSAALGWRIDTKEWRPN